ncbi:MAG: DUF1684 domain-containing protein [Saprospiraceae bacterium]
MSIISSVIGITLVLTSFTIDTNYMNWEEYLISYNTWKEERISELKKPMGYLSLTGLFWLKEGTQSLGSGDSNSLIFPQEFPPEIGTIDLKENQIAFTSSNNKITIDGLPSSDGIINSDEDGKASMFNWKSHFWYVIKRGDQYGIRLKDTLAQTRVMLTHVPSFEPQPEWIIKGKYEPNTDESTVSITNKIGITYDRKSAGVVTFEYNSALHDLEATRSGDRLFIVFADQTNGLKTYGGGRFLYVDIPTEGDDVTLDFNKVENPICNFVDFATCPLPIQGNYLPFKVTAGEKKTE